MYIFDFGHLYTRLELPFEWKTSFKISGLLKLKSKVYIIKEFTEFSAAINENNLKEEELKLAMRQLPTEVGPEEVSQIVGKICAFIRKASLKLIPRVVPFFLMKN